MSKREELRQRRQGRARRMQLQMVAGVALVAIAATGWLVYQNTRPIGEIKPIATEVLPFADGKSLGSATAAVLVEEYSDFQ